MRKLFSNATGILLFRQLAAATRNKLPYHETLDILSRDPDMFGRDFPAVAALARQLADGCQLSAALQRLPELVAAETAELVKTAESEGNLAQVLDAIADDYTELEQRRIAVRAALMWPLTILGVASLLITCMMLFVVPAFSQLFESFGANLPGPTRALIAISGFFIQWWWGIAAALIALVATIRERPPGVMAIAERILLGVPFLRKYLAQAFAARAINWLRASHQSPQLTLAVLRHLRATTVFPSFALCLLNLETRLGTSQPLSQALLDLPPLPRRLALLMQLGEKTGDAGAALAQVADFSEAERIASLARFERFFVLAVYCILAAAVGLAVIGMYLPIFTMGEAVSS